jgi:hypothetical protein
MRRVNMAVMQIFEVMLVQTLNYCVYNSVIMLNTIYY